MLERNDILLSVILLLLILILLWICGSALLRRLGIGCLVTEHEKEDKEHKEVIKMDDEAHIDYSFEIIQPEVKKQTNGKPFSDNNCEEPWTMEKKFLNANMNDQVDSADEMSFIYDLHSETETDQQRKTKAISSRFAKYLDNVPGSDPVILISLHYVRNLENVVLAIIKVANLKPLFNNKMPDSYVRVDVWIGKKIKLKKKTFVMKEELNPVYNQKMEFQVSKKELEKVRIVLTIATCFLSQDGSPGHRTVPLHKLELGKKSTGSCLEHWEAAISTNKPIAKWHVFS